MLLTRLVKTCNIKVIRGKVRSKVFSEDKLPLVLGLRDKTNDLILHDRCHEIFDESAEKTLRFPEKKNKIYFSTPFATAYYKVVINARMYAMNQVIKKKEKQDHLFLLTGLEDTDHNRVTLLYMLSAWLTIDEFRWHKVFSYEEIPEDLSYGLVLDYPTYVLNYANYVLNPSLRRLYLEELSKEELLNCDRMLQNTLASL